MRSQIHNVEVCFTDMNIYHWKYFRSKNKSHNKFLWTIFNNDLNYNICSPPTPHIMCMNSVQKEEKKFSQLYALICCTKTADVRMTSFYKYNKITLFRSTFC